MMDLLRFPSCKLYENGNFRLPNILKLNFQKQRIKKVVLLLIDDDVMMLLPASKWERNKRKFKAEMKLDLPVRAQSINATFLRIPARILETLTPTQRIYFKNSEHHYIIYTSSAYLQKNQERIRLIHSLADSWIDTGLL
jgi:hypothetical protein